MSFFPWKKNLPISDKEPVYKVRYLGNVQTAMMKGEGCVDKPINVIWNNYARSGNPGLEMKLTVTSSGLKAMTKTQGLTEYRAHRLSYCIAHPKFPKLFVWVYRHEGKKMKMELRCHAVLCKTEVKAKALAVQLADKLDFALREFMREKTRKQNSRLVLQRAKSLPQSGDILPKRTQMLSTGQKFKPSITKSNTAPKLSAITEDFEIPEDALEEVEEHHNEDEEEDNEDDAFRKEVEHARKRSADERDAVSLNGSLSSSIQEAHYRDGGICQKIIDIEIGNDIEALKQDEEVNFCISNGDSDDESSESGFHDGEQENLDLCETDVNLNITKGSSLERGNLDEEDGKVCCTPFGEIMEVTSL